MPLIPRFRVGVRLALRRELGSRGYSRAQINDFIEAATDDVIETAVEDVEGATGELKTGAIGDGKIIDAIIEFFKSEQGKALIDALIKLLLGLLVI